MPEPTGAAPVCANGHAMDPEWQVCPYCPSTSRPIGAAAATVRVSADALRSADPALASTVRVPRPQDVHSTADLARTVRVERPSTPALPPELARTVRVEIPGPAVAANRVSAPRKTEFLQRPPTLVGIGWLVAVAGPERGTQHRIDRERISVGAAADADARIDSPHVSDQHASIRVRDREWVITDLDSTNGTFVNDEPIHQHTLADGDRVRFGASQWVFKSVTFDDA